MEDLVISLFFGVVCGAGIGYMYTLLLNSFGLKVRYRNVGLILGGIVFLLGFINYEVAAFGLIGAGAGLFLVAIALLTWNLAKSAGYMAGNENGEPSGPVPLTAYYNTAFHTIVAILIIVSIYFYSETPAISNQRMEALIADSSFQFSSTVLLVFIGIFNPFIPPSATLMRLAGRINPQRYPYWSRLFSNPKILSLLKVLICIAFVCYFVFNGYFGLPEWGGGGIFMDSATLFTGLFIIASIIQLIKNPEIFFKKNVLRVMMLFQSAILGIFVAAIFILIAMLLIGDTESTGGFQITSQAFLFLGFNCIMAFVEYKIARHG